MYVMAKVILDLLMLNTSKHKKKTNPKQDSPFLGDFPLGR